MKKNIDSLNPATLRRFMQMDGGGDMTEEEIENCRKNLNYELLQSSLNNISKTKISNSETAKSGNQLAQNQENPNKNKNNAGMPDFGEMMKIMQQSKGDNGGMDFSKLMNNPELMKIMGNMGGSGGNGMANNPMMGSINKIIWFLSWLQSIFSFIFSIKASRVLIPLY